MPSALRIDLMTIQIDGCARTRMENRKFFVQLVLAVAAALVAGIAIGRFALFHI
jgi:hypothetical protein